MNGLKPCPFCGGEVDFHYNTNIEPDGIRCLGCGYILRYTKIRVEKSTETFGAAMDKVMDKMTEEWNRRADGGGE